MVVFDPEFWDQSRNTFPPRRALVMVAVTDDACSAWSSSAISLASAVVPSASRLSGPVCGRPAYRWRPLDPLVTGAPSSPRSASFSRTSRATAQHSVRPAGSPGSRSMTRRFGFRGRPVRVTVHWWTCSSSAARLTSQVSVARSSTTGNRSSPASPSVRDPVVGTVTVRTHDGVPAGAFFSKKLRSSTPCGHRIRVTARSARWGSRTGATRA
jgi:hypothetical protein